MPSPKKTSSKKAAAAPATEEAPAEKTAEPTPKSPPAKAARSEVAGEKRPVRKTATGKKTTVKKAAGKKTAGKNVTAGAAAEALKKQSKANGKPTPKKRKIFRLCGEQVTLGTRADLTLPVAESYSGGTIELPVHVWRGKKSGPTVLVCAVVHGDELNGVGIIRRLILDPPFELASGSLVLVPVVNVLGYERHSRYLPDRRDLNRAFPGSAHGSLARRYAHRFFDEIVRRCDFGIDLHTAAVRRVNYPNVRGDLRDPGVQRIAEAFGCEVVVNRAGPAGSLRREATRAGCPMIILEAGEIWKIEPAVSEVGVRGIRNVLIELGMVAGDADRPRYQVRADKTMWLRADFGGLLQFHVAPGDVVEARQVLATNSNLVGVERSQVKAPAPGVVLGMTTLPAVTPGEAIIHLAVPKGGIRGIRRTMSQHRLADRVRDSLATSVDVQDLR